MTRSDQERRRIAVVGSGVAGLTAAYVASGHSAVTLYEADDRLGGHADTHLVTGADGESMAIDTGFIVHNRRTYPTLLRLFAELDVPTQPSEMSMSVRSEAAGVEYAGARGLRGALPDRRALRPAHLRMLTEIPRFQRSARALVAAAEPDDRTLEEFLDAHGFTPHFRRHFMAPLVAAVWSCDPATALDYPARYLFEFLSHHGMLQAFGSPRWRTVTGGSATYVERVADTIRDRGGRILTSTKVVNVVETGDGVEITDGNGHTEIFDAVVLATHPGQSLAMLGEPTAVQREILSAFPYSANTAQLHTDTSLLPGSEHARSSWNYLERPGHGQVTVTYDLTRLMRLPAPRGVRHLVTLGGTDLIDPALVIDTMEYEHPLYTPDSVAAQRRADELDSDALVFAGAWRGWGFHEDGARSGARAAERLGLPWSTPAERPEDAATGIYRTTISHTRRAPLRNRFVHRSHWWVVDLDRLPDHGILGRFEARDHLGEPGRSIRENLAAFLRLHDIDLADARVLMAAQPRALGFCFNPISVYWCITSSGAPLATVVEVHNTYGDRHAYLVHPDEQQRAQVEKAMYVSPFHGVDGSYDLTVPRPDGNLAVTVRLNTAEGAVFGASVRGVRVAQRPTYAALLRAAPAALIGAVWIRVHGIALWMRRLPVQRRSPHHQEGVR
ncbi:MAG: FAD-dependent oxidoreductase [Nocardioides sp.]|uniref:FAD-dependent oxidoreductase n=1 Tax=Nocardioides sp. TaxID=35761 RepID=UPI003D6B3391